MIQGSQALYEFVGRKLPEGDSFRLAMSGTPMQNSQIDLYSQVRSLFVVRCVFAALGLLCFFHSNLV